MGYILNELRTTLSLRCHCQLVEYLTMSLISHINWSTSTIVVTDNCLAAIIVSNQSEPWPVSVALIDKMAVEPYLSSSESQEFIIRYGGGPGRATQLEISQYSGQNVSAMLTNFDGLGRVPLTDRWLSNSSTMWSPFVWVKANTYFDSTIAPKQTGLWYASVSRVLPKCQVCFLFERNQYISCVSRAPAK